MSSTKPVLHYWKGRGRAEIIRLTLAAVGVEWEDAPYLNEPADFEKLRSEGKLFFNQLPLLQMDGMNLVQTIATVRYIAAKHGLNGKTPEEQYRIDLLSEGLRDFYAPFFAFKFQPDENVMSAVTTNINRYMPIFEKTLTENGHGHLVGDRLTMADVQLLEILLSINHYKPESFASYPNLKAFMDKISALPSIAAYLKSDKRFPPNNDEYCTAVNRTLGR